MDAFGVKISDDRKRLPPTNDHRTRNVGGGRKNESKKCETHFFSRFEEPHTVSNSFGVLDELISGNLKHYCQNMKTTESTQYIEKKSWIYLLSSFPHFSILQIKNRPTSSLKH